MYLFNYNAYKYFFRHLMGIGFISLHTTKMIINPFFKLHLTGVTEDDYMRRMEVIYCVACDSYIPVVFSSVQQHLHSLSHLKSKMVKSPLNILNLHVCLFILIYTRFTKGSDKMVITAVYIKKIHLNEFFFLTII